MSRGNADIDNLIAAFSVNANISQEARDLVTLQAQLASLMQAGASSSRPCPTTPTMPSMELAPQSTPSTSRSSPVQSDIWSPLPGESDHRRRSREPSLIMQGPAELAWRQGSQSEMEEEQAVEDALFIGQNPTPYGGALGLGHSDANRHQAQYPVAPQFPSSDTAAYAAMDPFLAAQLQASQASAAYYNGVQPGYGFASRHHAFATARY